MIVSGRSLAGCWKKSVQPLHAQLGFGGPRSAIKSPVSLVAPKLAVFNDQIVQNKELFARIAAVYDAREAGGLTPEQKRLVWLDYTRPPSAPWS